MKVSVVIPCRNEEKSIAACVEAILNNSITKSEQIEVLIIDGMSSDNTRNILNELKLKYTNISIIDNPKFVTPVAFNLGINYAKGEYIQIVGARQIISENYLEEAVNILSNNSEIWCVGGAMINVFENKTAEIVALAMDTPFGVGGGNWRLIKESGFSDTAGTPMYPAKVFNQIGLFDENLVRNQDDELNYRVIQNGGKIYLLHTISIKYYVRAEYGKLFKQYFQYGYWKVYVNRKLKTITTYRQLAPVVLVSSILLGALISLITPLCLPIYLLGIGIYLTLAIYFGLKTASKIQQTPLIIKAFFMLHFGYGLGYLKGIIDFLIFRLQPSDKQKELSR